MIEAVTRVGAKNHITLGDISINVDPDIEAIVSGWPAQIECSRAELLDLPIDENIDRVIQDFIEDFLDKEHAQ